MQPRHHRHEDIIGDPKVTVKTGECQDELVLAISRGLRTQLQADGKMEVNSVGPHFTGHEDEEVDEEDIAKFYDDASWAFGPSSASGGNQIFEHVPGVQEGPRGECERQGGRVGQVVRRQQRRS